MSETKGVKFDGEKTRMELLPPLAQEKIARVFTYGAKKYSSWNWSEGMKWSRLFGALNRHINAWYRGEDTDFDPECQGCQSGDCKNHSGEHHLAAAGCSIMMLLELVDTFKEGDDRPTHYKAKDAFPPDMIHTRLAEIINAKNAQEVKAILEPTEEYAQLTPAKAKQYPAKLKAAQQEFPPYSTTK